MTERLAFDLSRYTSAYALIADLSSLALEASENLPIAHRINPFTLTLTPDGRVVDKSLGDRDVSTYYSDGTKLDRREREAGLKIRANLVDRPLGTISVWLSPPGGPLQYKKGRITVGINTYADHDGGRELRGYGIVSDYSSGKYLEIAGNLENLSDRVRRLSDPEDLREEVFVLPALGRNPYDMLRIVIPMDEVWDAIEDGEADRMKEKARRDAIDVFARRSNVFDFAVTERDFILFGATLEQAMINKGWGIESGACGTLNKDVELQTIADIISSQYALFREAPGLSSSVSLEAKQVHKCPQCGKLINSAISRGYQCECGGVYDGC